MTKASTAKITPAVLQFWLSQNLNVMFEGRRGVGKTAMVKALFESAGLKWKYFSAATMDPWCDFVGIPRATVREDGKEVLEYVLPAEFADDSVEAIFVDEFNRAPKKVRDAVMELIQFKTINGRPFKNLRVVWAAINPKDEEEGTEKYQVEDIDPAVLDRFHVFVRVPYAPDRKYFEGKYGSNGRSAVNWWHELPESAQKDVSPRRLEYGLQILQAGGNTAYVFATTTLATTFAKAVKNGSTTDLIEKMVNENDVAGATAFLKDANNIDAVSHMLKDKKVDAIAKFYLPLYPAEKLTVAISKSVRMMKWVVKNESLSPAFAGALDAIVTANQNKAMVRYIIEHRPTSTASIAATLKGYLSKVKTGANTTERLKALKFVTDNLSQFTTADMKTTVGDLVVCFIARSQVATLKKASVKKAIRNVIDAGVMDSQTTEAVKTAYSTAGIKI